MQSNTKINNLLFWNLKEKSRSPCLKPQTYSKFDEEETPKNFSTTTPNQHEGRKRSIWFEDDIMIPNLISLSRKAKIQMKEMKIKVELRWRKGRSWEKWEEYSHYLYYYHRNIIYYYIVIIIINEIIILNYLALKH